ncbi:MAG TPA: endonuclease/exonuclease/phosphatase family protein [Gemmatimonadales bacterium]|nr:endonuclease/exonuclease/phosphatase family protein [Gemmatimonadales bacterium]
MGLPEGKARTARYPAVTALAALLTLAAACAPPPLRVMSFNIRYGTAPDGDDAWPLRRERTIAVIREAAPDILGVQEALRFQLDELAAAFPAYRELGVGRDDGKTAGEYAAILYRSDRLSADTGGTFWLSDTPETPGSMSWGNRITRIATWVLFTDRETSTRFAVFNVHLDHESQPSRERGVALILERMERLAPGLPVIFTGDFNAGEDNPAVQAVSAGGFTDTFRARHPDAQVVGTFNAFRGDSTGAKIDYVLVRGGWDVDDAAIVRTRPGGRDASDHFAVMALLRRR